MNQPERLNPSAQQSERHADSPRRLSLAVDRLVEEIRHQDFARLEASIDAFLRTASSQSGFPLIRPSDCRAITEALGEHLEQHRLRFEQGDPVFIVRFLALLERFSGSSISAYPNEVMHLDLLRAKALIAAGKDHEALTLLTPLSTRPYRIEGDASAMVKAFELDTVARFNLGYLKQLQATVLGRLLLAVRLQPRQAGAMFRRFSPALAVRPVFPVQYSLLEVPLRLIAKLALLLRIRTNKRARLRRWLLRGLTFLSLPLLRLLARRQRRLQLQVDGSASDYIAPPGRRRWSLSRLRRWFRTPHGKRSGEVLVTRAMGGLGDIVMMIPGLEALAARIGRPVHFATKKQFFPVLENNPNIRLLDIDEDINISAFKRWVNLSFCPAAKYESRVYPRIRKGRVELFARAMGVRVAALRRSGLKPNCHLSLQQAAQREQFRAQFLQKGRVVIGVQPYSRETYRNYPGIFAAMTALGEDVCVVYFHTQAVPAPEAANVVQFHGRSMRETLPAIAACDYFVCVDSAFLHIAAAFDIPTLTIFGPTKGSIRTTHHPRAVVIEAPESFPCAPCWRNEDTPCYVSGTPASACLTSIGSATVTRHLLSMMALPVNPQE